MFHTRSHNRQFALVIFAVFGFLVLALVLAGCATPGQPTGHVVTPAASQTPEALTEETPEPSPYAKFGETYTWADNVSITVNGPSPFVVSNTGIGTIIGQQDLAFVVTFFNGSENPIEVSSSYATASAGGKEASKIFDVGNAVGRIGETPSTSVLPGQSVEWVIGFSVADPNSIVFEIQPGFAYDKAIFTNVAA